LKEALRTTEDKKWVMEQYEKFYGLDQAQQLELMNVILKNPNLNFTDEELFGFFSRFDYDITICSRIFESASYSERFVRYVAKNLGKFDEWLWSALHKKQQLKGKTLIKFMAIRASIPGRYRKLFDRTAIAFYGSRGTIAAGILPSGYPYV